MFRSKRKDARRDKIHDHGEKINNLRPLPNIKMAESKLMRWARHVEQME